MLLTVRPATPEDVDFLIGAYERAYRGGYSACFDRYGAIGPEDFWWVQSEKTVSVVEIDRAPAGLLVLGKDGAHLLVEELLIDRGDRIVVRRLYEHLDAHFKKARQDRILLRTGETNAAALALAQEFGFTFVDALVVAGGAAREHAAVPAGYTIRRTAPDDARRVAKLMDEFGVSSLGIRRSRPRKREGEIRVWIAERERYTAGFSEARVRDAVGWWNVAVREAHRGRGLGGALAGAAVQFCQARHLKPITTYWALEPGAAQLAQRLGAATERTYLYLQKNI